jgi:hypothetical protein
MNRELLQQALTVLKEWDALIKYQYQGSSEAMSAMQYAAWNTLDIIAAIEAELAKPEQEPAYFTTINGYVLPNNPIKRSELIPRKAWVGLTDEEIKNILDCGRGGLVDIKKAEAKLKDKNT